MRKKTIYCSEGNKVGTIIDVVFTPELKLHSFIVGGSLWEELREQLGFIDDIDPVIPVDNVKEILKDKIVLRVPKKELKHKLQKDVFPENAITYSYLKRKDIIDQKGKIIGRIVNLIFVPCGEAIFVLGGSMFKEFVEKLGLKQNIDLLLPLDLIKDISDKGITLTKNREQLEATIDNKPLDNEAQRDYLNSLKKKGEAQMRVMRHPEDALYGDQFRTM
jgi:sporulation protein YlmC with PRC-barrel domain